MATLPRRYWAEMSSRDFTRFDTGRAIAVLPVGAIEQHGPHLPLSVDTCLLDAIIAHAVNIMPAELPVTVLPTLSIGKSNEHSRYPGTLTFGVETLMRMWMEMGACVAAAGIRKLLIFNSHGGQVSVMDVVARDLRVRHDLIVVASSWFALGLPEGLFDDDEIEHGIHGGAIETSMMLAVAPDQVNMQEAADFASLSQRLAHDYRLISLAPGAKLAWQSQDLNPQGACGNALAADAAKGEAVLAFAARRLVELLQEIERLPPDLLANKPAW